MATVRDGHQAAMVIVDMQVGVVRAAWQRQRIVANVSIAVERARSAGVPVVWVQHSNHELPMRSPPWQLVPELVPARGEAVIQKKYNSSFEETALDAELDRLGTTHMVLAGAATNWCMRATAYGALERGYDLTLVEDAHTTESMQLEGGSTLEAAGIVRELNIAMKWLEYPGRRNGTATANDLDFASLAKFDPTGSTSSHRSMSIPIPDEGPRADRPPVRRFRDPAYRPQAPTLGALREEIDSIDAQVVELLAARARCVKDATRFKRNSFEVTAPRRQAQVFARVRALAESDAAESPALPDLVEAAYRVLVAGFITSEERFFAETEPIDP